MERTPSTNRTNGNGSDEAMQQRIDKLFGSFEQGSAGELAAYLEQDGDPDARDENGFPLLVIAAFNEVVDAVAMLIGKSADPNKSGLKNGTTALMAACEKGNLSIVKMLLEAGADPSLQNNFGQAALLLCARGGFIDLVTLLLEHGAPVDAPDLEHGRTALSFAAGENYIDILRLLLSKGANVETRDLNDNTPLIMAGAEGSLDLFKLLVESGADVNACNYVGLTPLLEAVGKGNYDACEYLIGKGADVNFESLMTNAVSLAKLNHRQDIVDLLVRHGARP